MKTLSQFDLLADFFIFSLFQILFILTFFYSYIYDKGWLREDKGFIAEVKRGEKSWGYFHTVYGFLSVIFLEIINTTDSFKGYKTIITIFDLSMLLYMCFFSSWFRNKIVGIVSRSQELIEK